MLHDEHIKRIFTNLVEFLYFGSNALERSGLFNLKHMSFLFLGCLEVKEYDGGFAKLHSKYYKTVLINAGNMN